MVARFLPALTLFLLLSLPHLGQAQTPALNWRHEYGTSRNETEGFSVPLNGGYLLAGERSYFNGTAALLYFVQTNALGDTLWTKTLSAPVAVNPHITGFVRDAAGNLLLTGTSYSANVGFVMKLTSACVPVWDRVRQLNVAGADFLRTSYLFPTIANDGNYVFVEYLYSSTTSTQTNTNDDKIIKVNQATGVEIWATNLHNTYATNFNLSTSARALIASPTGYTLFIPGYIAPGYTPVVAQLRLSTSGAVGSIRFAPNPAAATHFLNVLQETSGSMILTGRSTLTKLNAQGDTLWTTSVPPAFGRQWDGAAITQDRQGNYIVLGNSYFRVGGPVLSENIHLARFRPNGQLVNDTMLYRPSQTYGRSLHLAANGELVVSGYSNNGSNGGADLFMLQFRGFRPLANRAAAATVAGFAVYPNPAAGSEAVRLTLPERPGPRTLVVFDGLGRAVRQQVLPATAREALLPVAGLPPGLYLLRLSATDGQTWTTKLLRE